MVRKGVTLMELLVVLGVFSITVTMASAIFLQSNAVQRRVILMNAAQADLRFSLEAMVREVRQGGVDYAFYERDGGVELPTDRLAVTNPFGQLEEFFMTDDPTVCPEGVPRCLAVSIDGAAGEPMTSRSLIVDRVLFYVTPNVDPFTRDVDSGLYLSDIHPSVTMIISGRTNGVKAEDVVPVQAQTTVSTRTYAR